MKRYIPKFALLFRDGYSGRQLAGDVVAGFTVAVIALPFALAVGIGSIPQKVAMDEHLLPPAMAVTAAIVGGFLISLFGGSRVNVGGPSAVAVTILFAIAAEHGYVGLATATLMAGIILVIMGVSRLGVMIKFIPYPVTTGFTAGSAVIIATAQVRDFFGIHLEQMPSDWVGKVRELAAHAGSLDGRTFFVGAVSLVTILLVRKLTPRLPAYLAGILAGAGALALLGVTVGGADHVATLGSRFGHISAGLHLQSFPAITLALIKDLVPAATTIAILVAVEGLLTDVVADGLTGTRHQSDQELVAMGLANIACALVGTLPVTGGLSRTVANIKAGAMSPVAGMVHALVMLVIVLTAGQLMALVPLAALSAVLFMVAWNMTEIEQFRRLLRAPRADVTVLLTTLGLTVFFGLITAVGIGMVLAAMLFMQRMGEIASVRSIRADISDEDDTSDALAITKDAQRVASLSIPPGVEIFEINGPFFFAVANKLEDILMQIKGTPKVFILRMRRVPHIDATGLHALEEFQRKCARQGTVLLLGGVHAQPMFELVKVGLDEKLGLENIFEDLPQALVKAREMVNAP
ncbi:MAG: SulP family inorganic anion transporter [Phycisphaerales bacterium]